MFCRFVTIGPVCIIRREFDNYLQMNSEIRYSRVRANFEANRENRV